MPPECGFIAINATALNIAINGSVLAKPTVLSAPVDQGACWRAQALVPVVEPESNGVEQNRIRRRSTN